MGSVSVRSWEAAKGRGIPVRKTGKGEKARLAEGVARKVGDSLSRCAARVNERYIAEPFWLGALDNEWECRVRR